MEKAVEVEAQSQLQGRTLGVRQLARLLSVSGGTVTRWRNNPAYRERIKARKGTWGHALRDEYFEAIKSKHSDATEEECFQIAFRLYGEKSDRKGKTAASVQGRRLTACRLAANRCLTGCSAFIMAATWCTRLLAVFDRSCKSTRRRSNILIGNGAEFVSKAVLSAVPLADEFIE
jgi:hypothetical protein